jgi:copper chaperone CopZ
METKHMTVALYDLGFGPEAQPVEAALRRVPGVVDVYIDPATERAYVDYDPARCDRTQLAEAVGHFGVRIPSEPAG